MQDFARRQEAVKGAVLASLRAAVRSSKMQADIAACMAMKQQRTLLLDALHGWRDEVERAR